MSEAVKAAESLLRATQIDQLRRAAHGQTTTTEPAPALEPKPPAKIIQFPLFPDETRPASNSLSRSSLFAAIKGKDRVLLKDCQLETVDGWKMFFSGEQLNQDDHDTLMQLVFMAKHKPVGEYVTVPAHAILKGLGRDTGGKAHEALKAEIKRLVAGTVELSSARFDYIGHLVEDAAQDKTNKYWVYRLNPKLSEVFRFNNYTLIDQQRRQDLKRKDLARWLQLHISSHATPFPMKVETLRDLSGSRAKSLRHYREALRRALDELKANGDIAAWEIDSADLVHIDRTPSPAQIRHITKKASRKAP